MTGPEVPGAPSTLDHARRILAKKRKMGVKRPPRPSMRKAIDAKCRECTYDPLDRGTWRMQTGACTSEDCPLWPLRPVSSKGKDTDGKA